MIDHKIMFRTKNATATRHGENKDGTPVLKCVMIQGVVCNHCENHGMVLLDANGCAAPCPMCSLGAAKEVSMRVWVHDNAARHTWDYGLSIEHTGWCSVGNDDDSKCYRPALEGDSVCDTHKVAKSVRDGLRREFAEKLKAMRL